MEIKKEYGFGDLLEECWSGAVDTLKTIRENDKEEELMNYLKELFYEEIPSITTINDFLWFQSEEIYEALGIMEDSSDEEL